MSIYRIASFHVRAESLERCKHRIEEFVQEMKVGEPGTRMYVSLQDQINPNHFMHVYAFADEAAESAHNSSDISRRFSEFLMPELVGPVSFGDFAVVAET
jgi:quinol monooxygenase YgiN